MTSSNQPLITVPRVLSIAGTDPTGGAGTAADTKSIQAAGGFAMCVTTALVAQNTQGVREIHVPPLDFLSAQLAAVSDDVAIDAVKTGMLGSVGMIERIGDWLTAHRPPILVVDPVMIATSGDRLLDVDAEQAMREFCRQASVITPNIGELAVLTGNQPACDEEEALDQARAWSSATGVAVVVKTGHLTGNLATNHWVGPDGGLVSVPTARIDTTSTHGTGCSLSSALATRLALGADPADALGWVTDWLHEAIAHGPQLQVGKGHGPVDHSHRDRRLAAVADPSPWLDGVPEGITDPAGLAPDVEPVPAVVEPVGDWTRALWRAGTRTAQRIADSAFVRALTEGDLGWNQFRFYIDQDARYLAEYARALTAIAAKAPTGEDLVFWSDSATNCLVTESGLHEGFLAGAEPGEAGPVTTAYTDFLVATAFTRSYVVAACAALPCYWLYAQTGGSLPEVPDHHPYAAWLAVYSDKAFTRATEQALELVERALAQASPVERRLAVRAYLTACRHELEFFEQATRLPGIGRRR